MDNKLLNIGVAGCGHLGKIHCRLLSEISKENSSVNFTGIYDIDENINEQVSRQYLLRKVNSLDELLNMVNTLIIVTPTSSHFEIAKKALTKNINVFIEKPVTSSISEAEELQNISKNSNALIQIGHIERFNSALKLLDKFEIKPMFIESHRLAQFNPRGTDVSVILDLMIHDIDLILYLTNSSVKKIEANGVSVISKEIDIANARLTLENNCVANITSSRISLKKMRKMRIFQQNAYISIDFLNNKTELFQLTETNKQTSSGMNYTLYDNKVISYEELKPDNAENYNPLKLELESFFESILKNKPVKVTLNEAKQAVAIANNIIDIINSNNY